MIDEHAAAVLALLNGVGKPAPIRIDDGKAPSPLPDIKTNPYVLVYVDSNDPESDKEAAPYRFEMTATIHCVGGSARAARMVADWVRTALLGVTPAVAGRSCFPITREPGVPPQKDEATGSTVMDEVDIYTLTSLPG